MTRIIYEKVTILLETNGDCSSITLNFMDDDIQLVQELRRKLKSHGFPVQEDFVNDNQLKLSATFLAPKIPRRLSTFAV